MAPPSTALAPSEPRSFSFMRQPSNQAADVAALQMRLRDARASVIEATEEGKNAVKKAVEKFSAKYAQEEWAHKVARLVGAVLAGLTKAGIDKIRDYLPDWLEERLPDEAIPLLVGILAVGLGYYAENEWLMAMGEGAVYGGTTMLIASLGEG